MPFDSRSVVAETVPADSVELCSNQRSGCKGGFGGDMDHTSTDRTWTSDSEAGASSIDAIQLNNICSASESSSSSPDQPAAATEALESPSLNKALKRDEGVDRGAEMDNSPTASTSKGEAGGGGGGPTSLPESLKYPRKSLPLLPRMNQYERHPLLQVRPGAGLSEFELFLLEKDLFKKRCSVDDQQQHSSESVDVKGVTTPPYCIGLSYPSRPGRDEERKLIPRSAHYEPHPLLRKSVSGVCELELYLMEKNEEVVRKQRRAAADDDDDERTNDYDDNDDDDDDTAPATTKRRQIRSKLEPRLNQWEKHALLEVKDKSGLSEVDRLFLETEQHQQEQQERGKCAAECVCKGATCKRCKKKQRQQQQQQTVQSPTSSVQQTMEATGWRGDSSKTSDDSSSAASAAPLLCQKQPPQQHGGHQTKRVHFERQKNDADDSGIASSDASCPATRQEDVSASEATARNSNATTCSRQPKKDAEDGDEIGRDGADAADDRRNKRALRTDKQQPGNKSCCMS